MQVRPYFCWQESTVKFTLACTLAFFTLACVCFVGVYASGPVRDFMLMVIPSVNLAGINDHKINIKVCMKVDNK